MTTAVAWYTPVALKKYLSRLEVLPASRALDEEFWTRVHEEVQAQLAGLETDVRRQAAGIRVDAGRTNGDGFYLFSYLTFSVPDSPVDPVVAGLTFTPVPGGLTIEADVSGEQTGDWVSTATSKTVRDSPDELLRAARESARGLRGKAEAIAAALKNSSRRVN